MSDLEEGRTHEPRLGRAPGLETEHGLELGFGHGCELRLELGIVLEHRLGSRVGLLQAKTEDLEQAVGFHDCSACWRPRLAVGQR